MTSRALPRGRLLVGALLLTALTGCAGADYGRKIADPSRLPPSSEIVDRSGFASDHWLRPAGAYRSAVARRIETLRTEPMTEERAVEVALLNAGEVQAFLAEHDAARAGLIDELARAQARDGRAAVEWLLIGSTMAKPRHVEGNSGEEGEREPVGVWDAEFGEIYLEVAETVLEKAREAREAYWEAVGAQQVAAVHERVLEAAGAGIELANEQYRSGTLSRLDQAKEHLAYAEVHKAAARARQTAMATREALNRVLLLDGAQLDWALPAALPELPAERPVVIDPEGVVLREGIAALAARAGAGSFSRGIELRSLAREAHATMLGAYDLARFQAQTVLPSTEVLMAEQQLHYNAMIDDIFDLLEAAKLQMEAEQERIEALAEFWKARSRFVELAGGRWPSPTTRMTAADR